MTPLLRSLPALLADQVIRDFGIENESPEAKEYLLNQLADNISGRVLLEATKLVPEEKRAEFTALIEGTDADAIERFLSPYIADLPAFVQSEAQKEIERTRAYMLEETEGAVTGGGQ